MSHILGTFVWALLSLCFFASYLQIGMVSSILAYNYGSTFAWITSVSVATYIAFTLAVTQVRTLYSVITSVVSGSSCFYICSIYLCLSYHALLGFLIAVCFHYDSGGLSSGKPWIKLIMLLVQWQLTPFWIMRSSHGCPLFWCLVRFFTHPCCNSSIFLPILICLRTDCQILQQWAIWSSEVWQIFKEWVHISIHSCDKCHHGLEMHSYICPSFAYLAT